jgi:hypothetical protein
VAPDAVKACRPVRNYYTGEKQVLGAEDGARLLVILAADLMEQDPFFSVYLPCACLRLAGPHLQVEPVLLRKLRLAGTPPQAPKGWCATMWLTAQATCG